MPVQIYGNPARTPYILGLYLEELTVNLVYITYSTEGNRRLSSETPAKLQIALKLFTLTSDFCIPQNSVGFL